MQEDSVVLVNELDQEIGTIGKLEAHQKGLLHRAFSIFIFNEDHQLMLQKRALDKYHSPGLWTNTCCSHPRPSESIIDAAHRRLQEEMGFDCDLKQEFSFIYKAQFDNQLIEHELDHVVIGQFNGVPILNLKEVSDYRFEKIETINEELNKYPERFTAWFKICWQEVKNKINSLPPL